MGRRLNNAPLFFTLAQVRHNPVLSLPSFIPQIQEKMRKVGYPGYFESSTFTFGVNLASAEPSNSEMSLQPQRVTSYNFVDAENSMGFTFRPDSISFQTVKYDDFESFWESFRGGLEILWEVVGGLSFIERLGLRYLDAVIPRTGESLDDYLIPQVLGIPNVMPDSLFSYSFSEATLIDHETGSAISRIVGTHGSVGLPPDITQLKLELPEKIKVFLGEHAIMDTDAFFEKRKRFDISDIGSHFDKLHDLASKCFKVSVTQRAREIWDLSGDL